MPQTSPAGGLSLIIHIFINIIVFTYRNTIKTFGVSEDNRVSSSFEKLTNKDGDTLPRKILSYSLVLFILLAMSGNFVLVIMGLANRMEGPFNPKVEAKIITEEVLMESEWIDVSAIQTDFFAPLISIAPSENETFEQDTLSTISLVDFLKKLGIVDASFTTRAELAKELGVVSQLEEYTGSQRQNRQIIIRINKELAVYAETNPNLEEKLSTQ
jgi:hypothetical protein